MQTKQLGALTTEAKETSAQQASKAYVSAQQGQRVLPAQLAQGGLAQSGYRSLAQQKMGENLVKNQQAIGGQLQSTLSGYGRSQEANNLSYTQNVADAQNSYNQNVANLNLDKKQADNKTSTSTSSGSAGMTYNDLVLAGNTGRLTYAQYKLALDEMKIDAATKSALLQNYLRYEAARGVQ